MIMTPELKRAIRGLKDALHECDEGPGDPGFLVVMAAFEAFGRVAMYVSQESEAPSEEAPR